MNRKDPKSQTNVEWLADYNDQPKPEAAFKPESQPAATNPRMLPPNESPLIPIGRYIARCLSYVYKQYWQDWKIYYTFEIVRGPHAGNRLERYYNIYKNAESGEFVPPGRGAYAREMRECFRDGTENWANPENLVGRLCRIQVETVDSDHRRQSLGKSEYSKVAKVLGVMD